MEGLDAFIGISTVLNGGAKVNRDNAPGEFLKMLCFELANQMLPDSKKEGEMDLARKIFATKLASQIKQSGTLGSAIEREAGLK